MELIMERGGGLSAVITDFDRFSSVDELKSEIGGKLFSNIGLDTPEFYLLYNGRILNEIDGVEGGGVVRVVPRVLGGKGGFGSMLRAIGAQIEKTTNRDACRDLSGRRLRDINEEQRLKKWYAKQKEREEALEEAKRLKIEKLKRQFGDGAAKGKIDDQDYLSKREAIEESVYEAVDAGFAHSSAEMKLEKDEASSSSSDQACDSLDKDKVPGPSSTAGSSTSADPSTSTDKKVTKIKRTMFDDGLDTDSEDEDSEDDIAPSAVKKSKLA